MLGVIVVRLVVRVLARDDQYEPAAFQRVDLAQCHRLHADDPRADQHAAAEPFLDMARPRLNPTPRRFGGPRPGDEFPNGCFPVHVHPRSELQQQQEKQHQHQHGKPHAQGQRQRVHASLQYRAAAGPRIFGLFRKRAIRHMSSR